LGSVRPNNLLRVFESLLSHKKVLLDGFSAKGMNLFLHASFLHATAVIIVLSSSKAVVVFVVVMKAIGSLLAAQFLCRANGNRCSEKPQAQ
jgi:hypothetical protein